jgi:rhodanese-related sulfurtransferase
MLEFIKNIFSKSANYTKLSSEDFEKALKTSKKHIILDVRHKHEFDGEKIHNALNMDIRMPNFKDKMKHYDQDKSYYVYCQSGGRSAKACRALGELGFENLFNLEGGLNKYEGKTV